MRAAFFTVFVVAVVSARPSWAQKAPELGYVFPPVVPAGSTAEVVLGGYDWTPDMQLFIHCAGAELNAPGQPGPILVPEPPYWFGPKSYLPAMPLAREMPARVKIPADCPAGPVYWQASNANGSTATGILVVSNRRELIEAPTSTEGQEIGSLPVSVSGQLVKNEEVDRYRFAAPHDGPITCVLWARRLGSSCNLAVEILGGDGKVVADALDTEGIDPELTFAAQAGRQYTINVREIDFRGDRAYVYRLLVVAGPRVIAALPAAARPGALERIEFVGVGVATGKSRLEAVYRELRIPSVAQGDRFNYVLQTPFGDAPEFPILLSNLPEKVERLDPEEPGRLEVPIAITGTLDEDQRADIYLCNGKAGQQWAIKIQAREIGSPIDPLLVIRNDQGREVARSDDGEGAVDCQLDFALPADGTYAIAVSDLSGKAGSATSTYRLAIDRAAADFSLHTASQWVNVFPGQKKELPIKLIRRGGFQSGVKLSVAGLPARVAAVGDLAIPEGKDDYKLVLEAGPNAAASASPVRILGTANVAGTAVIRDLVAPSPANLAPRGRPERTIPRVMVAVVLKPVCKAVPLEKDGGRRVHRGSTFPAPIEIQRLEGFTGEVFVQMASRQQRHRQGIRGAEVLVPAGITRAAFACYMPEWLETSRTSRMAVVGVAPTRIPKETYAIQCRKWTGKSP